MVEASFGGTCTLRRVTDSAGHLDAQEAVRWFRRRHWNGHAKVHPHVGMKRDGAHEKGPRAIGHKGKNNRAAGLRGYLVAIERLDRKLSV